jgi:hypothetical protein
VQIDPKESAVMAAFAVALGHASPFSTEELAGIPGPLIIRGARRLDDLVRCAGLQSLQLIGGDRGRMLGNPWDPSSYDELRPELLDSPSPRTGLRRVLEFSRPDDWKVTRTMFERGIELCFAEIDDRRGVLVRPGVARATDVGVDAIPARGVSVEIRLRRETPLSTDGLFADLESHVASAARVQLHFASHRILGNDADAQSWIDESSLAESEKRRLRAFVAAFPDVLFYRLEDPLLDEFEKQAAVELPAWLRAEQSVLVGAFPDEWLETVHSTLVAKFADEADRSIYELDYEIASDQVNHRHEPPTLNRVFSSYGEMLAHVVEIELADGRRVTAREKRAS